MDKFEAAAKALKAAAKQIKGLPIEATMGIVANLFSPTREVYEDYETFMSYYFSMFSELLEQSNVVDYRDESTANAQRIVELLATMHLAAKSMEGIMTSIKPDND